MPDDDQIGMEQVEDRLLCRLSPADQTKFSGDIRSGAESPKVRAHQSRGGFSTVIEF